MKLYLIRNNTYRKPINNVVEGRSQDMDYGFMHETTNPNHFDDEELNDYTAPYTSLEQLQKNADWFSNLAPEDKNWVSKNLAAFYRQPKQRQGQGIHESHRNAMEDIYTNDGILPED